MQIKVIGNSMIDTAADVFSENLRPEANETVCLLPKLWTTTSFLQRIVWLGTSTETTQTLPSLSQQIVQDRILRKATFIHDLGTLSLVILLPLHVFGINLVSDLCKPWARDDFGARRRGPEIPRREMIIMQLNYSIVIVQHFQLVVFQFFSSSKDQNREFHVRFVKTQLRIQRAPRPRDT